MNSEQWQKAKDLFEDALRCPLDERGRFLDENCGGDVELRREVESLLFASEDASEFLEQPAVGEVAAEVIGQNVNLKSGKSFAHYEIVEQIGAGGMGEVYLARDTKLKRAVALKMLPAELVGSRERVRRFEQEAFAASALNHPNILTIYEIGEENDVQFIASEYVDGKTLRAALRAKSLTIIEALELAAQTASALAAAHSAGIVHRDIKPENIMLRGDNLVKVLDFGLAKLTVDKSIVTSEDETRAQVKTEAGMILGTAAYMSPEQARGKTVDARTDIFSLGIVLYEMLCGKPPFAGETASDVIAAILQNEPAPLARFVADVPPELERIVGKALRKDREQRYQHINDLLIDIKDLKQELEFTAKLERSGVAPPAKAESAAANKSAAFTKIQTAQSTSKDEYAASEINKRKFGFAAVLVLLLAAFAVLGGWFFLSRSANTKQIESIAVMPFQNDSGNADVEYLSDGMTETLIGSLSQIPKLNVKARSSVFRYKGKETDARTIGKELNVQAILTGRVVQRGDDLTLFLSLVDAATEYNVWSKQYNRKLTSLVVLQTEIARDVANNLKTKLSGADERRLAKSYTANPEAYQLYLKGRFHLLKTTRASFQAAIPLFQQAIEIDSSYALAYVGLADAYRSLALAGELPAPEVMPKGKAAANKALEIDETLAEAHAILGFIIFWYEWDWDAAENQFKRALEIDPNNGDTRIFYAGLLSNLARHDEALAEARRAVELDPLNLRTASLEAQYLIYALKTDEALARLQKIIELDPNYWFPEQFRSIALIEKQMYAEAIVVARKSLRNNYVTRTISFLAYAQAKSGKQAEARAELEKLLKLSRESYIPPYNIALVYNGLGEREETLKWLEIGIEKRDPRMTFLKVEPKWNNLRDDARFQDLVRRVGLPQ